jgi:hypothetical protein
MNVPLPNFFIVGAAKSGTTALYVYLREHPDIFMPAMKEPNFFVDDIPGIRRPIQTLSEYVALFAPANDAKKIGEASTLYFVSKSAPFNIKTFAQHAQIIIMLRNPMDKMYARFSEARLANREHHKTFQAALEAEKQQGPSAGLGYWESARYVEKVRRYFEMFGRSNVHVIIYDDFVRNTKETYEETLHFLEVKSDNRIKFPIVNSNRRVRNMALQEVVCQPSTLLKRSASFLPRRVKRHIRAVVDRVNLVYEPRALMDSELRSRLQGAFEHEIKALGTLLHRDLSSWLVT